MYAITEKTPLPPSLADYLDTRFVQSCKLLKTGTNTAFFKCVPPTRTDNVSVHCSGVNSSLNRKYYRISQRERAKKRQSSRNTTNKQSSSKKEGIRVHREIFEHVRQTRPVRHWMAIALVQYFENKLEHVMVASELPVYVKQLDCVTQVDLITWDPKNKKLHMWELKCGRGANKRYKNPIMKQIPNTTRNHAEFQRHFTCLGLIYGGVKIDLRNSHVINIYREKGRKTPIINIRKHPAWTQSLPF